MLTLSGEMGTLINSLLSSQQTRDDFLGQVDIPLSHLPVRTVTCFMGCAVSSAF